MREHTTIDQSDIFVALAAITQTEFLRRGIFKVLFISVTEILII